MWIYFLRVCVSIKIHCLLNTGLLPTCRNMCTHTHHTQRARTHTDTTLLHKLWCLTCRCVSLKGQERGTWVPTLQGGTLGTAAGTCLPSPRSQHMGPPCRGPGSSRAFVLFPAALWSWDCGTQMAGRREEMNESWSLGTRSSAVLQSASCSFLVDAPNRVRFIKSGVWAAAEWHSKQNPSGHARDWGHFKDCFEENLSVVCN